MANSELIERIQSSGTNRVRVAVTDIDGVLRGKFMHIDKFISSVDNGFGFCNVVFGWDCNDVCYDHVEYTGWHTGYPDAHAVLDPKTLRNVPWDSNVPFVLGDFVDADGEPLAICPRQVLKRVIAESDAMGYVPSFGLEFEWFNFFDVRYAMKDGNAAPLDPITNGMFGYSILRASQNKHYFRAIMEDMESYGVPIEGIHTETGPGVYEVAIQHSGALEQADRAILFKSGLKELAAEYGITPTFMAKWNADLPGCSGHMHQSLWDKDETQNLFYDDSRQYRMSSVFESYLAGQMLLLPELLPFYAPTVNSYKRLVEGLWAPTRVTWGVDNRTPALRVIPGSAKSTRLETRVSGSDINPYLSIAAALASGLYGIKNNLTLNDAPVRGNAYEAENAVRLPRTLRDASEAMRASSRAREIFGDTFIDHFATTRDWEWEQAQRAVTNWELKRYFEVI